MSYILDALKKSEQERKQGQVPGLNSFQNIQRPPRSTRNILLYLLIGFLVVNTLGVTLWLFFRQAPTDLPGEVITATTSTQTEQPQQLETDSEMIVQAVTTEQTANVADPVTASPTKETLGPEPETPSTAVEQATPVVSAEIDRIKVAQSNIQHNSGSEVEEEHVDDFQEDSLPYKPRLTTFANLPAEVRAALPEITIAAHYYASRPAARMASINGRIMRQGQTLKNGLVLEEIIRDGVIFSFHDYRFSLKVFTH